MKNTQSSSNYNSTQQTSKQINHRRDWNTKPNQKSRMRRKRETKQRRVERRKKKGKNNQDNNKNNSQPYDDPNSGQLRSLHLIFLQFTSSLRSHAAFWAVIPFLLLWFCFVFASCLRISARSLSLTVSLTLSFSPVFACSFVFAEKKGAKPEIYNHSNRNSNSKNTAAHTQNNHYTVTHTSHSESSFINLTSTFAAHLTPIRDRACLVDSTKLPTTQTHLQAHYTRASLHLHMTTKKHRWNHRHGMYILNAFVFYFCVRECMYWKSAKQQRLLLNYRTSDLTILRMHRVPAWLKSLFTYVCHQIWIKRDWYLCVSTRMKEKKIILR